MNGFLIIVLTSRPRQARSFLAIALKNLLLKPRAVYRKSKGSPRERVTRKRRKEERKKGLKKNSWDEGEKTVPLSRAQPIAQPTAQLVAQLAAQFLSPFESPGWCPNREGVTNQPVGASNSPVGAPQPVGTTPGAPSVCSQVSRLRGLAEALA